MKSLWLSLLLLPLTLLPACGRDDMALQPKVRPLRSSAFFADGAAARPLIPNTITTDGRLNHDDSLAWTNVLPDPAMPDFTITNADLQRGQLHYSIYCLPCHGAAGDADGMIVQRGLTKPPSFNSDRLRNVPLSHFYNVITNGYGAMYSYNDRVAPDDRWRIAAYIRVLQFSQHAEVSSLPPQDKAQAESQK